MVSEIPRVSLFGHCPYSVTFPYIKIINIRNINYSPKLNINIGIIYICETDS